MAGPYRIRVTPELRQVREPEVEYYDLPPEWAGWTVAERQAHLDQLAAETIEALAGVGVDVLDGDDNEVEDLART